MDKNFFKIFGIGLVGGVFGSLLLFYPEKYIYDAAISDYGYSQDQLSPIISTTPVPGFWERVVGESSLSSVGIQVFQDNKLIRQGSGIIVSSDGLIVTTADLAIKNSFFQIFYEDKILRGTIAAIDYKTNLLLLKTDTPYSNIADLAISKNYQSGQDIFIVGKLVDISKPVIISHRGIISYVSEKSISIDAMPSTYLSGSGVIDQAGAFIGLTYLRGGKINLIKADTVDSFIKEYLGQNNKK